MSGRLTENKIILVKRKTRLEELIVRYNTIQQAQFYIERLGADFSDYITEDYHYRAAVEQSLTALGSLGRVQVLDRQHVPNFIFGAEDIVVAVGQDGLVVNVMKYLEGQPLIGVNPDPGRWDGVLLPFTAKDLRLVVTDVLRSRHQVREVALARAELNDGQSLYGVNDLFIGRSSHVSARYELRMHSTIEQQSSSGIIVSTGMGSTGWLKSVLAGAAGITRGATGLQRELYARGVDNDDRGVAATAEDRFDPEMTLPWDHPELFFTVREPFPSKTTATGLVFGVIGNGDCLRITSQMPENGVIFSDGVEGDILAFNSGVEATIGLAEKRGRLVV